MIGWQFSIGGGLKEGGLRGVSMYAARVNFINSVMNLRSV